VVADVECTFPLSFAEVVWGDGKKIDRQLISATDLGPFVSKQFRVPFDAAGKAWVRFAVWDSAGNGGVRPAVWLEQVISTERRDTPFAKVDAGALRSIAPGRVRLS